MKTNISKMYEGLLDARSIFISDFQAACDMALLKNLKITAVVSVGQEFRHTYPQSIIQRHLKIPAIDAEDYPLQNYFQEAFKFIETAHHQGNVLIHCALGVSRSTAIFISYLIRKNGYTFSEALIAAKRKRPIVNPNKGFQDLLQKYSLKYTNPSKNQSLTNPQTRQLQQPKKITLRRAFSLGNRSSSRKCSQNTKSQSKQLTSINDLKEAKNQLKLDYVLQSKALIDQKIRQIQTYYSQKSSVRAKRALTKINPCCMELDEDKGRLGYCSSEF